MFVVRVETLDGLMHLRVYNKAQGAKLVAWCVYADSGEGRQALEHLQRTAPLLDPCDLQRNLRTTGQ